MELFDPLVGGQTLSAHAEAVPTPRVEVGLDGTAGRPPHRLGLDQPVDKRIIRGHGGEERWGVSGNGPF